MEIADLKKKGLSAVFWNLFGLLMRQGITFIISIFLARLLSPADFGIVGMAMVFITFTQGFADLGLTSGLILKKEPSREDYSSVFFFNLAVSLVLTLALFFSAGLIADYYAEPMIKPMVRVVSCSFIIYSLTSVQQAIFYKEMDVKIIRIASIISAAVSGVAGIILALLHYGAWSLILSTLLGALVTMAIYWVYSSWRPHLAFRFSAIKQLIPFGFRIFLINYMDQVYSRLDVLVIGKLFSPATLGQYFRASSFNQLIIKYSSQGLSGVFFPVISKIQDDLAAIRHVFQKSLHTICFISFILTGYLYVNAEPLIILLFSDKWYPAVHFFRILAFSSYVYPMTIIFNGVLQGTGNSRNQLRLEVIKKSLGVVGLGVGFLFGIDGYVWSLAITGTLGLMVSLYYIEKAVNISILRNSLIIYSYTIPLVIAGGLTVLAGMVISDHLLLKLIINSIIYLTVFLLTGHLLKQQGYLTTVRLVGEMVRKRLNIPVFNK